MKVSVVLQTFNNDNRILKTINSIRSQKNIKNYEIIIFDDRSTNKNFLKYLKFLSKKYKVKIIRPKKNYFSNNLNPGDFILKNVKGEFLAFCDPDDYWISKNKLITQYNFLKNNKNYIACYHYFKFKKNNKIKINTKEIHLSTSMFRVSSLRNIDKKYLKNRKWIQPGDLALNLIVHDYGLVKKHKKIFSYISKDITGIWSEKNEIQQNTSIILCIKNLLNIYKFTNTSLYARFILINTIIRLIKLNSFFIFKYFLLLLNNLIIVKIIKIKQSQWKKKF